MNTLTDHVTSLSDMLNTTKTSLEKIPKTDEYLGDRMYILGKINTLIQIRNMIK